MKTHIRNFTKCDIGGLRVTSNLNTALYNLDIFQKRKVIFEGGVDIGLVVYRAGANRVELFFEEGI